MTTATETKSDEEMFVIWTMIRFIAHLMGRVRERDLARYGITVKQAALLKIIDFLGDLATPVNIAKYLIREPSSISNILIRMEHLGLVKRGLANRNKRKVRVSLTEDGRKALAEVSGHESIRRVIGQLSDEDKTALKLSAQKLRGILLEELGLSKTRPGPIY